MLTNAINMYEGYTAVVIITQPISKWLRVGTSHPGVAIGQSGKSGPGAGWVSLGAEACPSMDAVNKRGQPTTWCFVAVHGAAGVKKRCRADGQAGDWWFVSSMWRSLGLRVRPSILGILDTPTHTRCTGFASWFCRKSPAALALAGLKPSRWHDTSVSL